MSAREEAWSEYRETIGWIADEQVVEVMSEGARDDFHGGWDAAIAHAAQIAERFVDHYPEDIFIPGGDSIDARSADVIRRMAPSIAREIREDEQ